MPAGPEKGWNVRKDDNSGDYTGPHWTSCPGDRRYPYLYKQAAKMKIVLAKWKIRDPHPGDTYTIKGTGPTAGTNVIAIPPTAATLVGTNVLQIANVAADNPFETNKVRFFNTFDIVWEVSVNGGAYQSAGKSNNPIYVCLKGPNPTGSAAPLTPGKPTPFRVVCHVACATEGATTADQAVINSWARLSGPSNLKAWDEAAKGFTRPLYYYKAGTTFAQNPALPTANLLGNTLRSTGQCSTWASLMYDALRLNNAQPDYVVADINQVGISQFLVKDWAPNAFAGWKKFRFGGAGSDMIPKPIVGGLPSEVYGDFTSAATLVGQNTTPPSQKVFGNHQFLKYAPAVGAVVYYDASYGVTYTGELGFQTTAVDGFARGGAVIGGRYTMDVKQTPAANFVRFRLNPVWFSRY